MNERFCSIAGMKKKSIDDEELIIPGSGDEIASRFNRDDQRIRHSKRTMNTSTSGYNYKQCRT
jgi:hypothetical protein